MSHYIYYPDFEYNGHQEGYDYEVPYEDLMGAIRAFFDARMVNMDGKDNDVWNVLVELEALDNVLDSEEVEEWLFEHCKEDAYQSYIEWCDWYYDEDEVDEDDL